MTVCEWVGALLGEHVCVCVCVCVCAHARVYDVFNVVFDSGILLSLILH